MPAKVLRRRKENPVREEPKQETAKEEEEEEEEPKPKSKPHDKVPDPSHWLFRKLF